jgi:hypothetical protein
MQRQLVRPIQLLLEEMEISAAIQQMASDSQQIVNSVQDIENIEPFLKYKCQPKRLTLSM